MHVTSTADKRVSFIYFNCQTDRDFVFDNKRILMPYLLYTVNRRYPSLVMNTGTLLNIVSLSLSFTPDVVTILILSHVYCHSIWTSQLDFRRAPGLAQSAVCPGPGCSGWWTTWCWPLARGHFLYMAQSLHFSWICLWNIGQQLVSPSLGTWKMNEVWYPSQDTRCSQNFCITIGCDL